MAQLLIRNLDDGVKDRLRRRALRHRRSMEEEARDILRDAVKPAGVRPPGLGRAIADLFAGGGLTEDIAELRGATIEPPAFD